MQSQPAKRAVVIAVANRKGGVGKTTTTAMFGTMLKMLGCRVLLLDNDPQANLSSMLGYTGYLGPNLYNVLLDENELKQCILRTAINPATAQYCDPHQLADMELEQGPFLVPITTAASNADFDLKSKIDLWIYQMKSAIETVAQTVDYVLIDCGPSLGTLTINAFAAADYVLIPVLPERVVVEGLAELIGVIATARRKTNPSLQIAGAFFSMVQYSWRAHKDVKEELRKPETQKAMVQVLGKDHSLRVFNTEIRHNAALANSTNQRSLLILENGDNVHTKTYWLLLDEILAVVGGAGQAKARQVVENIQAQATES